MSGCENKELDTKPELVIGLTGGIGTNFKQVRSIIKNALTNEYNYQVSEIKLSKIHDEILESNCSTKSDNNRSLNNLLKKMNKCNELRKTTGKKELYAIMAVSKIKKHRTFYKNQKNQEERDYNPEGQAYIIDSLKKPEEFNLLRKIYGRNFILISVYESEEAREKELLKKNYNIEEAKENCCNSEIYNYKESFVKFLIKKDQNESNMSDGLDNEYGQDVQNTFPLGHYFVNSDDLGSLENDIKKLFKILFSYPFITPSFDESMMFHAYTEARRSADLSRQIGAIIATENGEIVASGFNDVPKFGGGFYQDGDKPDHRDFNIGYNPNKQIIEKFKSNFKTEFKNNNIEIPGENDKEKDKFITALFKKSGVGHLIEFFRAVHAEEAAICDAARRGVSIKGCTLYVTTFPCHLCTKKIISSGVKRVVYIDPYPKSKAEDLFGYAVLINSDNELTNKVNFQSFHGVAPSRYLNFFRKSESDRTEKDSSKVKNWRPEIINIFAYRTVFSYFIREIICIINFKSIKKISIKKDYKDLIDFCENIFEQIKIFENQTYDDQIKNVYSKKEIKYLD